MQSARFGHFRSRGKPAGKEKMAINVGNAVKNAANTAVGQVKAYVLPMAIGAVAIGLIVGAVPAAKKFLM